MFRKLPRYFFLLAIIVAFLLTFQVPGVEGSVCYEPTTECYKHNNEQIKKWAAEITKLNQQERSLQNQIAYFKAQISITEAEIENAKTQIKLLSGDIGDLSKRLERISALLEHQEDVFIARARSAYASDQLSPFDVVLGADSLDTTFRRIKYLKVLETQDRETLEEIRETRASFKEQKKTLESKKADVESLKAELEGKTRSLVNQKAAQESFLRLTRDDQVRYKKLVEKARSAQEVIAQLVFRGGTPYWSAHVYGLSGGSKVSAGKRIATMSSKDGCSTGAHLHLQVMEGATLQDGRLKGTLVNPLAYTQSRCDIRFWDMNSRYTIGCLGWGSWRWPMSTGSNFYVTQLYGKTAFAKGYYRSGFHTGVDMVNTSNGSIYAISGGKLYSGKMYCSSGSAGVKIIDHGGGRFSVYIHVR